MLFAIRFPTFALLACASLACATLATPSYGATVEFNRDILPILSDKCFTCHGPDAAAKKIPFRLDSEAAAKAALADGKHAIQPGNTAASELINRITTDKKGLRMPPVYSGMALSSAEVDKLTSWIQQGAKWQQHWAFIAPQSAPLPTPSKTGWVKNPIDNFILARLEKEKLSPAPEATRETLIRRVSFDLTGLPPTPAETDAFLHDPSPNAYERLVDRLLTSPRYGEHMATRWLDAARYADSNGYQYDAERTMWPWRDWVIRAFNSNKPFDRFALEQIAGDLLPNSTTEQRIATGFNRNHRLNTEDGIIPEEYAAEYVVDRVDTTSTVFLGLTLACARCHNHKYDPFTQKEFYQVFAYFNNIPEQGRAMKYGNSPPIEDAPTDPQKQQLGKLDERLTKIAKFLTDHDHAIAQGQAAWEHGMATGASTGASLSWSPIQGLKTAYTFDTPDPSYRSVPGKLGTAAEFDGTSFLDGGDQCGFDITDRFSVSAWVNGAGNGDSNEHSNGNSNGASNGDSVPDGPIATRMEDHLEGKGYSIGIDGGRVQIYLTSSWLNDAIRIHSDQALTPQQWHHLVFTYAGSSMAAGVKLYIDGSLAKVTVDQDNLYRPFRNAGKAVKDPFRIGGGWGPKRRLNGRIDDLRVFDRVLPEEEVAAMALGEPVAKIARRTKTQRTPTENYAARRLFLETAASAEVKAAWQDTLDLRQQREALVRAFPTVMVMAERPQRNDTFILVRGAYNVHGDKVEPGVPAVLSPLPPGAPSNRLGFAEWLIDKKNPLLARVTINRFWQSYFGTGLVKTTEDFGRQGEWPSHPELLDWLAVEFMRTGWDTKAMQKLIVMSAAYRQASEATPELLQRDPENRLLARGPRFRLSADEIRDQALYAAGLLVESTGGPPVKPYQPDGLWREISMQDMDYVQDHGDKLHRRTLYTFWKRTVAPPMLANFDSALRESCVVRDSRTNTPLQALNLMNDVTFLEAARVLGQRMIVQGGNNPDERIRYGFRLVAGRAPTPREQDIFARICSIISIISPLPRLQSTLT